LSSGMETISEIESKRSVTPSLAKDMTFLNLKTSILKSKKFKVQSQMPEMYTRRQKIPLETN